MSEVVQVTIMYAAVSVYIYLYDKMTPIDRVITMCLGTASVLIFHFME